MFFFGNLFCYWKTGTIRQCCDAIDHLRRIIEKKHVSLNKEKKRRLPQYVILLPFPFISS
jgi:hypothetical protein